MTNRRILTVQDISCVGQCSMAVALPVLATCGHAVSIFPASVLSTHTGGFGTPAKRELADFMEEAGRHWRSAGICFDVICTGYLGSIRAIQACADLIGEVLAPGGMTIADPAMADHGRLYSGLDGKYAGAMMELCRQADVMLPNTTEAAMLAGMPLRDTMDEGEAALLLNRLGGRNVVMTGVGRSPAETGVAVSADGKVRAYFHRKVDGSYYGTGDLFAAAFTGALAGGRTLYDAARIAADFTCRCAENTFRQRNGGWYGVRYETELPFLMQMLQSD